mmetsp:Transcript_191/g.271  ORF Transcript_191/g.271 Transcript_191/m.271 type:complete len:165 (-) Transcript_191:61-555(-)
MAQASWHDDQIPLILGNTAEELFPLLNLALPAWLLLVIFPKWKYTQGLALIPPLIHAAIYTWSAVVIMFEPNADPIDFSQLGSIVQSFKDPNVVFLGWTHYLVFDLVVGRAISKDAVDKGISMSAYYAVVVPCLFLTLMLGPVGFLLYHVFSFLFLKGNKKKIK